MVSAKEIKKNLLIAGAVNSELRLRILETLCSGPKNLKEVVQTLETKGYKTKYRETAFRSLEKLADAGLVEKTYQRRKGVIYNLKKNQVVINFCK